MNAPDAPATVSAALARAVHRLDRTLEDRLPALVRGEDADYGRTTRVATRKLRVILGVGGAALLGRKTVARLLTDLRWLGRLLGQPRDIAIVRANLPATPSPWLARTLQLAHGAALQQAALGLRGPHLVRLRLRLAQVESRLILAEPPLLEAAAARATHAGPGARVRQHGRSRGRARRGHRRGARIPQGVRKLRYCCDLLKAHKQTPWRRALGAEMRDLQDWLGQFQDLATRIAILSQIVERQRLDGRESACLHDAEQWIAADQARVRAALLRFPARYAAFAATVESAGVREALEELQALETRPEATRL
ncbi:CHAD domain-containing protein [Hankyongella ginsenosidimutans]|uniref:CHAD domain-containing protein n=1 Tax=Hankyongella ginsenosidimutans TaxID=1763828 RepID=UPI001CA31007|nr:CHAD domain-containing protein [Hankyongella ginsenosidimutans]